MGGTVYVVLFCEAITVRESAKFFNHFISHLDIFYKHLDNQNLFAPELTISFYSNVQYLHGSTNKAMQNYLDSNPYNSLGICGAVVILNLVVRDRNIHNDYPYFL
jgi:hypothetical protein